MQTVRETQRAAKRQQESPSRFEGSLQLDQAIKEAYHRLPRDVRAWLRLGLTLPKQLHELQPEVADEFENEVFNDGEAQDFVPECPDRGFWQGVMLTADSQR